MIIHDLRSEDAYLDRGVIPTSTGLVTISGWACGEDIRPGDTIVVDQAGSIARYKVSRITSRFSRGMFFWTAACKPAQEFTPGGER